MLTIGSPCEERLILDCKQIEEDLKVLKVPSKITRTITFAIRQATKDDEKKIEYTAFVYGLQKCRLKNQQEIAIKRFVLDRSYPDKQFKLWPPPLFMTTITSIQTIFYLVHILHLHLNEGVSLQDVIWCWDSIPEPVHRRNFIYNFMFDDPQNRHQVWRYFTTMFVYTDFLRYSVNTSLQLIIGVPLELEYSSLHVMIIYIAGQISGCIVLNIAIPEKFGADALPAIYALLATQFVLFLLKWNSNYKIRLRKLTVWIIVGFEIMSPILRYYIYQKNKDLLEDIILNYSHLKQQMQKLGLEYKLPDVGSLYWHIDLYEHLSHAPQLSGALTGILLGPSIFHNKRNSSLKIKHLKVLLASVYVFLLIFSIMWISRTNDFMKEDAEHARIVQKEDYVANKLESLRKDNPKLDPEIVSNVDLSSKKDVSQYQSLEDSEKYARSLHGKLQLLKEKSVEILKITEKLETMM